MCLIFVNVLNLTIIRPFPIVVWYSLYQTFLAVRFGNTVVGRLCETNHDLSCSAVSSV